jgi:hypothetical protein
VCVGMQDSRSGGESCGGGPNANVLSVYQSEPSQDGPRLIYGAVTPDAREVRVELADGDPVEVKPLTEEAEEAGFEDIRFYVVELEADQEAENIIALGKDDKELASQPVMDFPEVKAQAGVIVEGPAAVSDMPTLVPPELTPALPPDAAAAAPPLSNPELIAPEAPIPMPIPRPGLLIDQMPVEPGFAGPAGDAVPVWLVHSLILLVSSVLLVVAGSYQLRRPRTGARFGRKAAA